MYERNIEIYKASSRRKRKDNTRRNAVIAGVGGALGVGGLAATIAINRRRLPSFSAPTGPLKGAPKMTVKTKVPNFKQRIDDDYSMDSIKRKLADPNHVWRF